MVHIRAAALWSTGRSQHIVSTSTSSGSWLQMETYGRPHVSASMLQEGGLMHKQLLCPLKAAIPACRLTPDALDFLPHSDDIILLNYYDKMAQIRDAVLTNTTGVDQPTEGCCVRLRHMTCTNALPKPGFVVSGGYVLDSKRYADENCSFSSLDELCKTDNALDSCHVGNLVSNLQNSGWSFISHPVGVCSLSHNPNPFSCDLTGGVYVDLNNQTAGCHDLAEMPLVRQSVDYNAFIQSSSACLCPK